MIVGGGKIKFAWVTQIIDFDDMDGLNRYVNNNYDKCRNIYYLDSEDVPHGFFHEEIHVTFNEGVYSIKVMLPYNNCDMGI